MKMTHKILIGPRWYPCAVIAVAEIPHWSGQTITCYTVRLDSRTTMHCGKNSLRKATEDAP